MKLTKHVLVLFGLVGLLGAFMPLAELRKGPVGTTLSAKELSFGLEKTHGLLDRKLPKFAEKRLPDLAETRDDIRLVAHYLRWAVLIYLPAGLLVAIGVLALQRQRLGRGLAAAAVGSGVVALVTWIALHPAIAYVLREADIKGATIELMLGAHMLLVPAAVGIAVGIAALVRPERNLLRRPG